MMNVFVQLELVTEGKVPTNEDVYSFGILLLESSQGRSQRMICSVGK